MPFKNSSGNTIVDGELLLFRTIWSATQDNMFIVKKSAGDFYSERTNPAMRQTLGLTDGQLDNIPLRQVLSKESYQDVFERYQSCLDEGSAVSYEEQHVINGKKTYWETTILPVVDESSGAQRIFGISRNVTELKELTEQLEDKVKERTCELKDALVEIERISITDSLTGLYNRYKLDIVLEGFLGKMTQDCWEVHSLAILDVDHFKSINDLYGHVVGDQALAELSGVLKQSVRNGDIVGRWGGEEFLIIMPNLAYESAEGILNRVCNRVAEHSFRTIGSMTVSIGATQFEPGDSIKSVISRADTALYTVKNTGRNSVFLCDNREKL